MVQRRGGGNLRRGGGGRGRVGWISEASNSERGIEIFANLSDYPISDGPSVDPGDGTGRIAAFDEDGGAEGSDRLRNELEGLAVG